MQSPDYDVANDQMLWDPSAVEQDKGKLDIFVLYYTWNECYHTLFKVDITRDMVLLCHENYASR